MICDHILFIVYSLGANLSISGDLVYKFQMYISSDNITLDELIILWIDLLIIVYIAYVDDLNFQCIFLPINDLCDMKVILDKW